MNKRVIYIITFIIMLLFSCSIDTIVDDPQNTYNIQDSINIAEESSKIDTINTILNLNIINDAKNVILNVNSLYIEGIEELKTDTFYFNDTILYNDSLIFKIKLNPQYLYNRVYVILNGKIYTTNYLIYKGLIIIPIQPGYINEGDNFLDLVLYNNCPWYYYGDNNEKYKILNAIEFEVGVNNWKNNGKIIN